MYQTHVKGLALFHVQSEGYGEPITTYGGIEQGDTPLSLLNSALASCVTMCVQGYYASQEGNPTMAVEVDSQLDGIVCRQTIWIDDALTPEKEESMRDYIQRKCRVKALLREELVVETQFARLAGVPSEAPLFP